MNKFKSIYRKKDVIYQKKNLEEIYIQKNFPIFMGCTNQPQSEDIYFEMIWKISKDSGVIQLYKLIPLNILYFNDHGSGTIGDIWKNHHIKFSNFLNKFKPKSVLEIGGGHGILFKNYKNKNLIDWTIVEPNPTIKKNKNLKIIKKFFDDKLNIKKNYDTIVHSHLIEHIYDPLKFIKNCADRLSKGNKIIFSVPNLQMMVKNKYTNAINFEHTIFLTEKYIEYLFKINSFKLVLKEYYLKDHSIFYAFEKSNTNFSPILNHLKLYEYNKKLFLNYIQYYKKLVIKLNKKIIRNKNLKLYIFGAHIFTQALINFGLKIDTILCVLDNDIKKHNKRLYGTSLRVKSPLILKNLLNPIVILKAGPLNNEISNGIYKINKNTEIWI